PEGDDGPESAVALVGGMKVLIPLAGMIDREAELKRLAREIDKLAADRDKVATKLGNENFVARAPADVVDKEREKHDRMEQDLASLRAQLERIRALAAPAERGASAGAVSGVLRRYESRGD